MRRTYFRAMQAKCERPEETCLLLEPLTVRIMEELKGIMLGSITARASVLDSVALLKSGTEASRTNSYYTAAPSRLRSCSGLTGIPKRPMCMAISPQQTADMIARQQVLGVTSHVQMLSLPCRRRLRQGVVIDPFGRNGSNPK
jgi:hypothetical protein